MSRLSALSSCVESFLCKNPASIAMKLRLQRPTAGTPFSGQIPFALGPNNIFVFSSTKKSPSFPSELAGQWSDEKMRALFLAL